MLSIIIPTLNAAKELPATFSSLMPALFEGIISEVIVVDGGSTDETLIIADEAGATIIKATEKGRGPQLKTGALSAKSKWLLFLHADTELEENWHNEASSFMKKYDENPTPEKSAAAFKFALKDTGLAPALLNKLVAMRCAIFSLPYGDQGLLISKEIYEQTGGYAPYPIMEDTDLVRRLPAPVKMLNSRAFTSAQKYQDEGYLKRSSRNLYCLAAYYRGLSPEKIHKIYSGPKQS